MRNSTYPAYFMQLGRLPTSQYARDGAVADSSAGGLPVSHFQAEAPDAAASPEATSTTAEQTLRRLRRAVGTADEVLATATTVFPFTLFPDKITIDREKITIAHRYFFRVAELISLRIEDVLHVAADVGPFFGSLRITSRFFDTNAKTKPYSINYLWRQDAQRLKRVLQGYLIARKNNIDCSKLSTRQLREALDKLGQAPDAED